MTSKVLVVEHEADAPPALLGRWLEEAGAQLEVCRPYAGDSLPDPTAYDALLVLGGAMGANDDEAFSWIGPTKGLLARAVQERVPTLGLCLGHQLLSAALGGTVTVNPAGHQVGHPPDRLDGRGRRRPAGRAARPQRHQRGRGALELRRRRRAAAGQRGPGPHRPGRGAGASAHPLGMGPAVAPRGRPRGHPAWADGDHQNIVERGIDRESMLAAIGASEHELTTAWAPLAGTFLAVVGQRVP